MALNEREAIRDSALLIKSLVVLGLVLTGFVLQSVTERRAVTRRAARRGLARSADAAGDAARSSPTSSGRPCCSSSGLFIMVGSLVNLGVIDSDRGGGDRGGRDQLTSAPPPALLFGSARLLGDRRQHPVRRRRWRPSRTTWCNAGGSAAQPLWWALALGADLGGNATAIGASANVVVLGIAKRNGHPISFWQFTKYGHHRDRRDGDADAALPLPPVLRGLTRRRGSARRR